MLWRRLCVISSSPEIRTCPHVAEHPRRRSEGDAKEGDDAFPSALSTVRSSPTGEQ